MNIVDAKVIEDEWGMFAVIVIEEERGAHGEPVFSERVVLRAEKKAAESKLRQLERIFQIQRT